MSLLPRGNASIVKASKYHYMPLGLYRLFWKGGGYSLAAVGALHSGNRWYACVNWTSGATEGIASTDWSRVEKAEILHG